MKIFDTKSKDVVCQCMDIPNTNDAVKNVKLSCPITGCNITDEYALGNLCREFAEKQLQGQ